MRKRLDAHPSSVDTSWNCFSHPRASKSSFNSFAALMRIVTIPLIFGIRTIVFIFGSFISGVIVAPLPFPSLSMNIDEGDSDALLNSLRKEGEKLLQRPDGRRPYFANRHTTRKFALESYNHRAYPGVMSALRVGKQLWDKGQEMAKEQIEMAVRCPSSFCEGAL
ncbi:hypothetical protein L596_013320 [Steinernema carpocapsae]|uniref:Uncharacterized protein n=1 Tax=Steinernema carpocapsae TaxID=34508 RepID=A0A4U5P0B3_STECR|nr:hypothetical protein L596_013320 [Steinernema carpocapsae]